MTIFNVIHLFGGLAMFLYGMNLMSDKLEKLAGGKLEQIFEKLTSNRFKGLLLGILVTAVVQSSSATTVMLVGFVNSGLMRLSQVIPIIMGANIGTTVTTWILSLTGLEGDSLFIQSIKNTFIYALIQVPVTIVLAFLMAMAANKKRKSSWFYELTFAFPMAVSMSVAALIFKLMLNPQIGIVNHIFGLDVQWFNGEKTALLSVIILGVWLGLGMDFLYLLSAVRSVPDDLIEAARIDGCPNWKLMFKIYLPIMSPTVFYLICTNLATAMMMSGPVMVLTKGGPNNSTSTIIYYMYRKAFEIYDYGQSYAAAVVGFVIAFVIILISFKFEKKGVTYD